ncbi:hypothetical protein IEQ34_008388 [Dendrobium chrysotoxum]|uniref:non-specific serine/threonine protein kinase n=1 Tax=Dendrobium chrysotoxum TaxID=161865 RepID=A0AAV7GYT3_DENCH|nr:hypothetical protein IEQ34_008388 [Dendrobium chrysotoxum]
MESLPLLFFPFLLLLLLFSASNSEEFVFNGFNNRDLQLDGVAEINSNGLLILTNATKYQQGHAFYKTPLHFKSTANGNLNSFSTCFAFSIVPANPSFGGHGLAFVLSPTSSLQNTFPAEFLGLFNSSNNGNPKNHVLAVELDTIKNPGLGDIDNNHVGIDINGLRSVAAAPASYYENGIHGYKNLSLISGEPMLVWVEYNSQEMKLNVTISPLTVTKPSLPLLSLTTNLSSIFFDSMYMGYSSSSGSMRTSHYVLGWSFKMNGQAPALNPDSLPNLPSKQIPKKNSGLVHKLLITGLAFLIVAISAITYVTVMKIKYAEILDDWELYQYQHLRFSYRELYMATRGFSEEELLGIGGFGRVYKGKLRISKTEIAVKRISHDSRQGMREFVSEIVSTGQLSHRNLVQLLGYCRRKGELFLVYEFMSNGSLDKFIYDETGKKKLNWNQRLSIIKGVASALLYLHEEWEQVVIHRDVKASNVLLDEELNAKLGDFGLSRLYDHGSDPKTTRIVGTMGYIAPELNKTGKVSTCTDVYAFGVLLLEVVCGRRSILQEDYSNSINLVDWLRKSLRRRTIMESWNAEAGSDIKPEEIELVLRLGLLCSHHSDKVRPNMRQVMQILEGDLPMPEVSDASSNL